MKNKVKIIPKDELIIRESFRMAYGGGEIWFEQLDALSVHLELVKEKFKKDLETIRRIYAFINDYEKAKEWLTQER